VSAWASPCQQRRTWQGDEEDLRSVGVVTQAAWQASMISFKKWRARLLEVQATTSK